MKPFKTYRQQVKILRERGLVITNGSKAMRILEKENYYSLINGYKDIFLKRNNKGKVIHPETYIDDATFEEIYSLYCFDRHLRGLLLQELLRFESDIKSKIAYRFSEKFREPNAYLNIAHYAKDPSKLQDILKLINNITTVISHKSNTNTPIGHYLKEYELVPLWVLVNYLTIGNIVYFYKSMDDSLRNTIAKDFSVAYFKAYNKKIHLTPDVMQNILRTTNHFRNVCAHEERLFNSKIYKPASSAEISELVGVELSRLVEGNLFVMVTFLKLVLSKQDYKYLISGLRKLFSMYETKFSSIALGDVLKRMGFSTDWEDILT